MGTAVGVPMRRYHSLLTSSVGTPANRMVLVNAVEVTISGDGFRESISTFSFDDDRWHPEGVRFLKDFTCAPWPTWTFNCKGAEITSEIFMIKGTSAVCLLWDVLGRKDITIEVRPFLTGRLYHQLHHENPDFQFASEPIAGGIRWTPYPSVPPIFAYCDGQFREDRLWFRNISYDEDRRRGSDFKEDWASPGVFRFEPGMDACMIFSSSPIAMNSAHQLSYELRRKESARRERFHSALAFAADHYIVHRGAGKTIMAGYPWFADWGRDTFISLSGLCLATGRFDDARRILTEWSKTIKDGLVPNRFVEGNEEPEYNSVDASLWFISACYEFMTLQKSTSNNPLLLEAIDTIIASLIKGTIYNIGLDNSDGLLRAGVSGKQITWMDAKIDNYVVTPRIGKPVEVQALWLNALKISSILLKKHGQIFKVGVHNFKKRFWNEEQQCLYDVIDVDHLNGTVDPAIRPNQIFAVGRLPFALLEEEMGRAVVEKVSEHLLTPCGLRTLSPHDPNYRPRYVGNSYERDTAYHQGTVWPWLMGAFIDAWVRINGDSRKAKDEARRRFVYPLLQSMNTAGLGHISEIHDAEFPHLSRGAPFQAWSVAEALRAWKITS